MAEKGVRGMTEDGFEQLRMLAETTNVIGDPIETKSGTTILPVCRVNVGYGGGGLDFSDEKNKEGQGRLGGGTAGGMTMTPVAFLTVSPTGGVSLLQVADKKQSADRAMNLLPGLIQQVSDLISKKTGVQAPQSFQEEEMDWDAYVGQTPSAAVYEYDTVIDLEEDDTNS